MSASLDWQPAYVSGTPMQMARTFIASTHSQSPFATIVPELLAVVLLHAIDPPCCWADLKSLTHVCRHWREVALSLPVLWRDLELPLLWTRDAYQQILGRSHQMPLRISVSFGPGRHSTRKLLRKADTRRIEVLHILCDALTIVQPGTYALPALRELYIRSDAEITDRMPVLVSELACLETMHLIGFPYPIVSPLFRTTLRSLHVEWRHSYGENEEMPEVEDLLVALSAMPLLEKLHIAHLFDWCLTEQLPNVVLPRLRDLHLETHTDPCVHILNHLTIPFSSFAAGGIHGICKDSEDAEGPNGGTLSLDELCRGVMSKLAGSGIIGPVPTPDTLKIAIDITSWDIVFNFFEDASQILSYRYSGVLLKIGLALDCVCSAAPSHLFASLRTLHLHHWDKGWDEDNFSFKLEELVGLEALYVRGSRGLVEHFLDQHYFARLDLESTGLLESPPAAMLPLHNLRFLSVTSMVLGEEPSEFSPGPKHTSLINGLWDMLELRNSAGIRLSLLAINDVYYFESEDAEYLRPLVDNLEWSG